MCPVAVGMRALPNKLKFKVSLYLTMTLWLAVILFIALVIKHQRDDLLEQVARHVKQISEVIVKSTRYAMLTNKRDIAEKIILDIGRQQDIERVRVLTADGTIIHSNRPEETGFSVEQQDEPCIHCHQTKEPLDRIPEDKRWSISDARDGHRSLVTMSVIRNEESCSSASCHEHSANQKILGIVDVAYSLDQIDHSVKTHAIYLVGISFGFILLVSVSVGVLLQRLIYLPLKDLESGADKVSAGALDNLIPVRSHDEFGRVADSFNHMTAALRKSQHELLEWVQTLESKVEERTQALLVAEAEIAQGEKLASVGMLASGIAHELNNPLTGVLTFTSLLRKKTADGSPDAEDLDLVIRETKRCASIIKRLLDFAREKVPVKEFFNLNRLVEDTVRIVERQASLQNIDIAMDLDASLPTIWGDADLIKQVILNIVVNAEQAIDGPGNIIVQTRPGAAKLSAESGMESVPMMEIAIMDTGCGIPEENRQRIFDPFFTSKEIGKGTGLGLSVSFGIVKAHGGEIKVDSEIGVGTTFHIRLPMMPPSDETGPVKDGKIR